MATRENKLDEALERAKAAVAADPQSAAAHFALAVVQDRRREVADATKSYRRGITTQPARGRRAGGVIAAESEAGDSAGALRYAEEARQTQPSNLDARVALARSLVVAGNRSRAETEIAALLKGAEHRPWCMP